MRVYVFFIFFILFYSCNNRDEISKRILLTRQTPLELYDSLSQILKFDGSVQFFCPYRGNGEDILRVVLDTPYSIMFDLSKSGTIIFFNEISESSFVKYTDKYFKGNRNSAEKFALDKMKMYKKSGVHTIAKGKNFVQFQTVYMDSSYNLLRQVNQNYADSFYLQLKNNHRELNGYCLGFYLFSENQDAFPYFSPRRLVRLNDLLFYYREPLLP